MSDFVIVKKTQIEPEKAEALKCAGLEFSYWAAMAVGSFLTVFLQSIGFTATQIGFINSLNSGVGIVSGPIWGMLSDKMQSIKKTMIICILGAMVLQAFIPASTAITVFGVSLIMLYMPFVTFFMNPSMILLDSWVIQSSHANHFTYSTVRSMGSLSWAAVCALVSMILTRTGGSVRSTFYIAALMMIPVALIAFATRNATAGSGDKRTLSFREMHIGELFQNYYFVAYLVYTFILSIGFMPGFAFYSYLLKDIGADITNLGYIQGLSAGIQFIVMLLVKPIQRRVPLYGILIIGNILTGMQYFLFGTATHNFTQMLLFASLHGVGSAFMISSGANFIYTLAPKHLKATAQTVSSSVGSIAGIIGNLFGGIVIDWLGIRSFYAIIGVWIISSVLLYAVSFLVGKRFLKQTVPPSPFMIEV